MADDRDPFLGRRIPPGESLGRLIARPASTSTVAPREELAAPGPLAESTRPAVPFVARPPRWKLDDLVVSEGTLAAVRRCFAQIEHHKTLYEDWGLSTLEPHGRRIVVNLYGLPGTGKTMCADAIASQLGKTILDISYAELESKYVGETPKNIVAAFRYASKVDAVLFFDEADSILGRRMTNVTQAADHSVNVSRAVMLKELDAFAGVVVFATNLARNFDGAFVRRILSHIEFPPPDESVRRRLWDRLVPERLPGRSSLDFHVLAAESSGLVGGDLKNAILLAAASAVCRIGDERTVTMDDLRGSLENIRKAKADVGRYDYGQPRVSVEEVDLSPAGRPSGTPSASQES